MGTSFGRKSLRRAADEADTPETANARRIPTKQDIMPRVPVDGAISKDELRQKANAAGIAWNRINPLIADLIADGALHELKEKRSGTNPRKMLSRKPPPPEELTP